MVAKKQTARASSSSLSVKKASLKTKTLESSTKKKKGKPCGKSKKRRPPEQRARIADQRKARAAEAAARRRREAERGRARRHAGQVATAQAQDIKLIDDDDLAIEPNHSMSVVFRCLRQTNEAKMLFRRVSEPWCFGYPFY
jgi:hypothetical protein